MKLEILVYQNGVNAVDRYINGVKDTNVLSNKYIFYRETGTTTRIIRPPKFQENYVFTAIMSNSTGSASINVETSTDGVNFVVDSINGVLNPTGSTEAFVILSTYWPYIRLNITANTGEVNVLSNMKNLVYPTV